VTNVNNGKSIVVRVNDRGPFHGNRALDVSQRAAEVLDFKNRGMARVRIDYVGPASLEGSDDAKLMATYRENGKVPATTALASLDTHPSDISGLYKDPMQQRLAAAHDIPKSEPKPETGAKPALQAKPAAAPQPAPAQPATADSGTTPPVDVAARIQTGFGGIASPQPLTQQRSGAMVEPVLSGFAFNPTYSGLR
jgi:rare lipoprotein A